ncbi:MAG TPA: DUF3084 domain-containing protein [Synergistales bacterium]|nr:DUF3084 domain-containing protein [Synergistales bacterium]
MRDFLGEFNWMLILSLIVASAIVAYVGDVVGMRIGKRRISLFGLRPRYTSSFITVLTGILITVVTLWLVSMTSETVRTALFSMKYVQRQITQLTSQLQESRQELQEMEFKLFASQDELQKKQAELKEAQGKFEKVQAQLAQVRKDLKLQVERSRAVEAERVRLEGELKGLENRRASLEKSVSTLKAEMESLKRGLEQVREGQIIVLAKEVLGQVPLSPKSSRESVRQALRTLVEQARAELAFRSGVKPEQVQIVTEKGNELENPDPFAGKPDRQVIRLVAESNAVREEPVLVSLESHPSRLIFKKGQELGRRKVPGPLKREEAERELFLLLREVNAFSVKEGVIPDPLRGTVGNLSAGDFYGSVEKLVESDSPSVVIVEAEEDVFSEGPVRVRIVLKKAS